MTVWVFTGPTLSADAGRRSLDARYVPPAGQGDVYRATLAGALMIGIIDGYFERVPAVWHKEILWALTQGVSVYGAASMGALRAAELEPFGMVGVGWVFQAYRDGLLEDDDEVAVAHGPAEEGYRPMSEPMVNIRRTLAAAEAAQVIGRHTRAAVEDAAKGLFYPDRNFPAAIAVSQERGVAVDELEALSAWIPGGRVDQKREDAVEMLEMMGHRVAEGVKPPAVTFRFEHTRFWQQSTRLAAGAGPWTGTEPPPQLDAMADELRLQPGAWRRALNGAVMRRVAADEATRRGFDVSDEALVEAAKTFRRERGLHQPEALERWLGEHHVPHEAFPTLLEHEAQLAWFVSLWEGEALESLEEELQASGEYAEILARARDKERVLSAGGLQDPSLADAGMTEAELLEWYFELRLARPVPVDVVAYLQAAGFDDEHSFRRALLREYLYSSGTDVAL